MLVPSAYPQWGYAPGLRLVHGPLPRRVVRRSHAVLSLGRRIVDAGSLCLPSMGIRARTSLDFVHGSA